MRVRILSDADRPVLGVSRVRGAIELGVWVVVGVVVLAALAIAGGGGIGRWVLAALLLSALAPYAFKSMRVVRGAGRLVADAGRGAFLRDDRPVVAFSEVAALHSRMVNATCEEFELSAQCLDGRRIVLFEGEPTNANYRSVERMARLAGVPFHHRL